MFLRALKKIDEVVSGIGRQINPFDGGATYNQPTASRNIPQNIRRPSAPQQQAPQQLFNGRQQAAPNFFGQQQRPGQAFQPWNSVQAKPQQQQVQNTFYRNNPQLAPQPDADPRSIAEKFFDQVNTLDNGRTFKDGNAKNNRSVLRQSLNNGATNFTGKVVKSVTTEPISAAIEAGRVTAADLTGNAGAKRAAIERYNQRYGGSIINGLVDQGVQATKVAYGLPGTLGGIARGFQGKAPTPEQEEARRSGLEGFMQTGPGLLLNAPARGFAKATGSEDMLKASGVDTNASFGKQFGDTAIGALTVAGGAATAAKVGAKAGAKATKTAAQINIRRTLNDYNGKNVLGITKLDSKGSILGPQASPVIRAIAAPFKDPKTGRDLWELSDSEMQIMPGAPKKLYQSANRVERSYEMLKEEGKKLSSMKSGDPRIKFQIARANKATDKFERDQALNTPMRLGDVIKHDKLFEAYSDYPDIPVIARKMGDGQYASFNKDTGVMTLNTKYLVGDNQELRKSIVHEVTHKTQKKEGLPSGGNPTVAGYGKNELEIQVKEKLNDPVIAAGMVKWKEAIDIGQKLGMKDEVIGKRLNQIRDEGTPEFQQFLDDLRRSEVYSRMSDEELYFKLHGEDYAFATEKRINMSQSEIAENPITNDLTDNQMIEQDAAQKRSDDFMNQFEFDDDMKLSKPKVKKTDKKPVTVKDVADMGKDSRKKAAAFKETKVSKKDTTKDFISQNFTDDTNYFQDLDKQIAKQDKKKVRNLGATERLDPQIQALRNADTIQQQKFKDVGGIKFAEKLRNQKTYDTYRIYRTYRTNVERAQINIKKDESLAESYKRATGGRDIKQDKAAFEVAGQDPKYDALFKEEQGITRKILEERGNNPNLAQSPEAVKELLKKYPNYTPQLRAFEDDMLQFQGKGAGIGGMQGKNVKELDYGSKSRPLDDPLTALRGYSDELVQKAQSNQIMNTLLDRFPDKFRPLVTAKQLKAKREARIEMKDLGLAGKAFYKELKKNKRLARGIQTELNELNRKGKNVSLKNQKEPNLAGQLVDPSVPMSPRELNSVLDNLINTRPKEVQRILNKMATRDKRLEPLLADISRLMNSTDDIKAARAGIMSSGDLAKFEKAGNKNTRRRVIDGEEEIYEVIDPRMAQNLDKLKGHELSKAASVLGVPTRVFKFFTTGPGSPAFIPIALTRDVLASILTAKAPLRAAFDPRSYIDAAMASAKKGEFFADLNRRGIGGTMVEGDRVTRSVGSDAMRAGVVGKPKVYMKNPNQLLRDVEDVGNFAERATRARLASGVYRQSLAKYKKNPEFTAAQAKDKALWDAAEEYREGAINFSRGGAVVKELNQVAAYLNPAVQGGNRVRRLARENPGAFAARAAVATGLIAGGVAYNRSSEERKAVYDKISKEEKRTNIIFVLDGASFDDKTGKASGIIKLALPYEFHAFTVGVGEAIDNATSDDYGNIALAGLAAISGLDTKSTSSFLGQFMPSYIKPAIENATNFSFFTGDKVTPAYIAEEANGDKSKEVKNSSTGVAKLLNKASGNKVSPIEVDNALRGIFGGSTKEISAAADAMLLKAGLIDKEDATESNPLTKIKKRFTESYGESDGVRFYNSLDAVSRTIPNLDDRKFFLAGHAKDSTAGILDSAEKASIWLNRPDVIKAERNLDARNRKAGSTGNPMFDLSDSQLQKVLTYRQAKILKDGKQAYDKNGNPLFTALGLDEPWYQTFRDNETSFYEKINKQRAADGKVVEAEDFKTFSGDKKPVASDELQARMDQYYNLPKGTGERSRYLQANPDILDHWEASSGFDNKERAALGLKPVEQEGFQSGGSGGSGGFSRSNGSRQSGSTKKYLTDAATGKSYEESDNPEDNAFKNAYEGRVNQRISIRKPGQATASISGRSKLNFKSKKRPKAKVSYKKRQ